MKSLTLACLLLLLLIFPIKNVFSQDLSSTKILVAMHKRTANRYAASHQGESEVRIIESSLRFKGVITVVNDSTISVGDLHVKISNIQSIEPANTTPKIARGFFVCIGFIELAIGFVSGHIARNIPSTSNTPEFYTRISKTFLVLGGATIGLGVIVGSVKDIYTARRYKFQVVSI